MLLGVHFLDCRSLDILVCSLVLRMRISFFVGLLKPPGLAIVFDLLDPGWRRNVARASWLQSFVGFPQ